MTGALSPVSPIELASPQVWHSNATPTTIQDGKTNMTPDQSLDDSSQQSSNGTSQGKILGFIDLTRVIASSVRRKPEWIPFTFRWYFLLIPTLLSVSFGIIIVLLVRSSGHNHGLGGDDGSSAILFGWRFTPTLLAVLYTQLTVILFEDAKRTEPHARLTKAPVTGASAYGTVLQTPRAWWAILMDVVVRRNVIGRTSWCLACAALVNVFAVLFISPLSSALLTSEEVSIPTPMEFFRMTTKDKVRLPIDDSRETYLRTMAALLRNVSTSAWITDSAITLPIWPLTEQGQFGSSVQSAFSSWTAESTTISAGMDCQNMTLESANLSPKPYVGWDVLDHGPYRGTEPMVTFALSSNVGCHYELTMHPATDLAYNGGIRWSNASTFYLVEDGRELLQLGRIPFARNVSSTSPYAQITASKQCDDKELILMSTPWTKTIKTNLTDGSRLGYNRTYERSTDFRMKALLCTTHVTLSRHETTVIMNSNGMPYISISDKKIMQPEAGSADVVDMDAFQQMSLQDEWKNYLYIGNDADEKTGGFETPGIDRAVRPAIPGFAGMAPLLGAMYGFDLNAAMNDFDISERIKRVKGRFLNECLHGTLAGVTILGQEKVMGKVKVVQQRVVVLREIGITIAALFFGSTILLLSVFLTSRLAFRPLNLHTDPGSTVGLSLLLQGQSRRSLVFRAQHGSTTAEFHRGVRSETFYSINGSLFSGGRGASCTGKTSHLLCQIINSI